MELNKDYVVNYYVLGITYLEQGRYEEAIEAHKKLMDIYPGWTWSLGLTYVRTGHIEEAEKILEDLEKAEVTPWNAWGLAVMYAALGNGDKAFEWVAYEPHHAFMAWAAVMPEFYSVHEDPRYTEFVEKLNLPD